MNNVVLLIGKVPSKKIAKFATIKSILNILGFFSL